MLLNSINIIHNLLPVKASVGVADIGFVDVDNAVEPLFEEEGTNKQVADSGLVGDGDIEDPEIVMAMQEDPFF